MNLFVEVSSAKANDTT